MYELICMAGSYCLIAAISLALTEPEKRADAAKLWAQFIAMILFLNVIYSFLM